MVADRFHQGEHVKARSTIFGVAANTRGTITQCYASVWGLYEVQFETSTEPRVVWAEELETDEPADIHEREN
jgi:hypothetical protein